MIKYMGGLKQWFFVEIIIFVCFLLTMFILLVKSRCMKTGINQELMFNELYMSKMINRIFKKVDFDLAQKNRRFEETRKYFTSKVIKIEVNQVPVWLAITPEGFETVWKNLMLEEMYLVPPDEAPLWMEQNILGNPVRRDLDKQRFCELSGLDIMMNTSIVYHIESIYELQIICFSIAYYAESYSNS